MCPVTQNLDEYSTQPLPTPTPTYENIKSCGRINNDTGQGVFTYAIKIDSSPSTVKFNYNTYFVPDRFIIELDDSIVVDTGYVGDTSYDESLISLGLPATSGGGQGSVTFNNPKRLSVAYLTVYAPLPNSSWSYIIECVAPALTPTNTQTITYTSTHTPGVTPTPTVTAVTDVITCGTYSRDRPGKYTYRIVPNSTTGMFSIAYNTYTIPDKFTVTHGTKTYTTGFVGDASYNSELESLGYPAVSGPSTGIFTFAIEKNVDTLLVVDAPLTGTVFSFTVICPTPTPSISGTPLNTPTHTRTPTPEPTPFKTPSMRPTSTPTLTPKTTDCPTPTPSVTTTLTPTEHPPIGKVILVESSYRSRWRNSPVPIDPVAYAAGTWAPFSRSRDGVDQVWSLWNLFAGTLTVAIDPSLSPGPVPGTGWLAFAQGGGIGSDPGGFFVDEPTGVPPMPAEGRPYIDGNFTYITSYAIFVDKYTEFGVLAKGQPVRYSSAKVRWWLGGLSPGPFTDDSVTDQPRFDANPINIAARMYADYTGRYPDAIQGVRQIGPTQRLTHPGDFGESDVSIFNILHEPGSSTFTLGLGPA